MKLGGTLKLVGWNQKHSYRSLEEALSVPAEYWDESLGGAGISNYVIISTCNRFEIYYYSDREFDNFQHEESASRMQDSDVVAHLFKVTAGLDSMSIGENEILHQVKEAFDNAQADEHVRDPLAFIFRKAISSGKLVRNRTGISKGKVSIPALSVDFLKKKHGVRGKKVAIIGTGKMSSDILKYIAEEGPSSITVIGRNQERAEKLARTMQVEWAHISRLGSEVKDSDIIITATSSPEILVTNEMMDNGTRPKVAVDISNPRNIEEPISSNFSLIDISALSEVMEKNRSRKKVEINEAGRIVREQTEIALSILGRLEVERIIGEIYRKAEDVRKREISKLQKELASGKDLDQAVEAMSAAIVKKLLAAQTEIFRNVHGTKVTEDIRGALENAFSSDISDTSSEEPQDLQDNRNQQARTPR